MKNPFEEYRAFSAWLVKVPEIVAMEHLGTLFLDGPAKDNMAYEIAEYYGIEVFGSRGALIEILERLKEDSKKYDLSGFQFLERSE